MYKYNDISRLSLKIINLLNDEGLKCTVLTKGVLPKELVKMSKKNEYGITLISLNEKFRKDMEPNSAPYMKRINSLKYLHDKGFKTWVSIEPYPTPNIIDQNLFDILDKISFVDKIIFGRLNYNKNVTSYKNYKSYYNNLAKMVKEFCKTNCIKCHIKKGTISSI